MIRKQQEINLLLSQIHTIALQGKNNTDNQADFARYKKISDIVKKLIEKTSTRKPCKRRESRRKRQESLP